MGVVMKPFLGGDVHVKHMKELLQTQTQIRSNQNAYGTQVVNKQQPVSTININSPSPSSSTLLATPHSSASNLKQNVTISIEDDINGDNHQNELLQSTVIDADIQRSMITTASGSNQSGTTIRTEDFGENGTSHLLQPSDIRDDQKPKDTRSKISNYQWSLFAGVCFFCVFTWALTGHSYTQADGNFFSGLGIALAVVTMLVCTKVLWNIATRTPWTEERQRITKTSSVLNICIGNSKFLSTPVKVLFTYGFIFRGVLPYSKTV
jgi:hypothetical protein